MLSISVRNIYIMISYFDNVRLILSVIVYKWLYTTLIDCIICFSDSITIT